MSGSAPQSSIFQTRASSPDAEGVDVCLLLEGTWPYVRGGVSTWVHQILTSLPELRFGVVFVGAEKALAGEPRYEPPPNLVAFREVFLFDPDPVGARGASGGGGGLPWRQADEALGRLVTADATVSTGDLDDLLAEALLALSAIARKTGFDRFWNREETWGLLQEAYSRHFSHLPFIDFFWNVRFLIEPVWRLLRIEEVLPRAPVYHSVSTGYAGLLGALAARQRPGSRFLLSEHGIYVRERISELLRAEWSGPKALETASDEGIPPLRRLWMDFFVEIGRFSYLSASRIVSLFQRNAAVQAEFGAPADRQLVIPNGVKLAGFAPIRARRTELRAAAPGRRVVGFYGRVVPIKDIKTLIRAARLTVDALPDATFLLVGPTDEDETYFEECLQLTASLDLGNQVRFPGPASPDQALPEFDVMVLSSASEGLPFAVLEAFASGMPVVSTDVGSCAELVYGREEESPALGPAGCIVPTGHPAALAGALIALLRDRPLQDRMGAAGLARTERHYDESAVIAHYRDLYRSLLSAPAVLPQPAAP